MCPCGRECVRSGRVCSRARLCASPCVPVRACAWASRAMCVCLMLFDDLSPSVARGRWAPNVSPKLSFLCAFYHRWLFATEASAALDAPNTNAFGHRINTLGEHNQALTL
eukprot:4209161-Pleurochrysis_carterae.AAC.1